MSEQLVIALGGNALGSTPTEQKQAVLEAAKHIAKLVKEGYQIVIVHGNWPQVGMINLAFELAGKENKNILYIFITTQSLCKNGLFVTLTVLVPKKNCNNISDIICVKKIGLLSFQIVQNGILQLIYVVERR